MACQSSVARCSSLFRGVFTSSGSYLPERSLSTSNVTPTADVMTALCALWDVLACSVTGTATAMAMMPRTTKMRAAIFVFRLVAKKRESRDGVAVAAAFPPESVDAADDADSGDDAAILLSIVVFI